MGSGRRQGETSGSASAFPEFDQFSHDVTMRQRPSVVFAGSDRYVAACGVVAHQPNGRGRFPACNRNSVARNRDVGPASWSARRRDQPVQFGPDIAHDSLLAIDDDLWGINIRATSAPRIIPLSFGERRFGEPVFPTELVPIGDGERKCEHIGAVGDGIEVGVGGRTGRTTLALE